MFDKTLTDAEWKKFSKGRNLKEAGLLKAIAAFDKSAKAEPAEQLEALADLQKQADLLLKEHKADKEVAAALGDLDKAIARLRKLADGEMKAAAKAAETASEGEDDGPAMLTSKLIPMLRAVKNGEVFSAMVLTIGKDTAVLMSRREIGPPQRKMLVEYLNVKGPPKVYSGQCLFEKNAVTFVLDGEAAGMAKRVKAALLAQTNQRVKVRVRGEDPDSADEDLDDLEGGDGGNEPAAQPRIDEDALQAAFEARRKELYPGISAHIRENGPNKDQIVTLMGKSLKVEKLLQWGDAIEIYDQIEPLLEAKKPETVDPDKLDYHTELQLMRERVTRAALERHPGAAKFKALIDFAVAKGEARDYKVALKTLASLKEMIASFDADAAKAKAQTTATEKPTEAPGTAPVADAAAFEARLAALEDRYQAVLKGNPAEATKMRAVYGYAGDQAEAKAFAKALTALGQLEKLLDAAPTTGTGGEQGYKGIVAYRTTLLELRDAVAKVEGQIAALQKAIPEHEPDEADLAQDLADDLREANAELQELVDTAMGAAENEDNPFTRELTTRLDELIAEVASNPVIKHVDKNPFKVPMTVEATLGKALKDVRAALPVPA